VRASPAVLCVGLLTPHISPTAGLPLRRCTRARRETVPVERSGSVGNRPQQNVRPTTTPERPRISGKRKNLTQSVKTSFAWFIRKRPSPLGEIVNPVANRFFLIIPRRWSSAGSAVNARIGCRNFASLLQVVSVESCWLTRVQTPVSRCGEHRPQHQKRV
jgi:hypothetical protein